MCKCKQSEAFGVLQLFRRAVFGCIQMYAYLFAVLPLAVLGVAVHMDEHARALLLVIGECANVGATVGPLVGTLAIELAVLELSSVARSTRPLVSALSVFLVVEVLTLVDVSIIADHAAASGRVAVSVPGLSDHRRVPGEEDLDASSVGLSVGGLAHVEVAVAQVQVPHELHWTHLEGRSIEVPLAVPADPSSKLFILKVVFKLRKWCEHARR